MTGHHVEVVKVRKLGRDHYAGLRTLLFRCKDCDLHGEVTASPGMADDTAADLMATHWAATGGERA